MPNPTILQDFDVDPNRDVVTNLSSGNTASANFPFPNIAGADRAFVIVGAREGSGVIDTIVKVEILDGEDPDEDVVLATVEPVNSQAIENITSTNPAVVTITGHGLSERDTVFINDTVTTLDENYYRITNVTADTFEIETDGSVWTSGGNASLSNNLISAARKSSTDRSVFCAIFPETDIANIANGRVCYIRATLGSGASTISKLECQYALFQDVDQTKFCDDKDSSWQQTALTSGGLTLTNLSNSHVVASYLWNTTGSGLVWTTPFNTNTFLFTAGGGGLNTTRLADQNGTVTPTWNLPGSQNFHAQFAIALKGTSAAVPVLSNPTATRTSSETGTGTVETDTLSDTIHCVVTQSATTPTGTQIISGQDHLGNPADFADQLTVVTTGRQIFSADGLTPGVTYWFHFVQTIPGGESLPISSDSFTTLESSVGPISPLGSGPLGSSPLGGGTISSDIIGIAVENNATLSLNAPEKSVTIGIVSEANVAPALVIPQIIQIGLAVENDTALGLSIERQIEIGIANELNFVFPLDAVKEIELPLVVETNVTLGITLDKSVTLTQVEEINFAPPLIVTSEAEIGLANEVDSVFPVTVERGTLIGLANEDCIALPITVQRDYEIGIVSESNEALPVSAPQFVEIGFSAELNEALPLDFANIIVIGQAEETNEVFGLTVQRDYEIGIVSEVNEAINLDSETIVFIGQVEETNEALPLVPATVVEIGLAEEFDNVFPLLIPKVVEINQVVEIDTALPVTSFRPPIIVYEDYIIVTLDGDKVVTLEEDFKIAL